VDELTEADDVEPLVVALKAQAWAERTLLALGRAKALLDTAATLARRAKLEARLGEVLVLRSAVNQELGRKRAAQQDLDRARPLVGGPAMAELEHHLAVLHQNAGRLREAAVIYRRVLSDPESPPSVLAKDANNLGVIEAEFGNFAGALDLVRQARERARDVGPAYAAYFTESHATILARAGLLPESLAMFEEAERLYDKAGIPLAELYAEYADAMSDLWLLPEAMDAASRALDEWTANQVAMMGAEAELRVARLALLMGDASAAATAATGAAEHFRRDGRTGWAALADVVLVDTKVAVREVGAEDLQRARHAAGTLERLHMKAPAVEAHLTAGRAAELAGRVPWAIESFERGKALARRAPVLVRLKGRRASAAAEVLRGNRQRALRECRDGLVDLDGHRGVLASAELRVLASAHGAQLGQMGLRTALAGGSAVEAFRWMERTRAAALLSVEAAPLSGFEEELAQLRTLQSGIESGEGSAEDESRQAELEARLRRMMWSSTSPGATSHRSVTLSDLRGRLGSATLVEYGVLDGTVFAVVVRPRVPVRIIELGPIRDVEATLERLFYLLRMLSLPTAASGARMLPVAEQLLAGLRGQLVQPLALPPDEPLIVVPVGVLQRVPWPAVHDGPVALNPSAAFWLRASHRPEPAREKVVLAAGPGLSAASDEVRALAAAHPESSRLVPPASTVTAVTDVLQDASLAHFACHGSIRVDNPVFSGLILCDGPLTVQELELRGLAPYRVVLAACEAAADATYPGGESLGFVSALLARGTAGIIASTVLVSDAAATPFMLDIHRGLYQGTLSDALHSARGRLDRSDPPQFVNWCGFVAFGAA
jgi:tetratricopeptide (TPR) repeat protein